jgi:SAM-dependent methyltransferase
VVRLTADTTTYPSVFEELAELEPRSFWFRGRALLLAWSLERYFPAARTFLEVGCGTGYTLAEIHRCRPELNVTGGDLFPEGLRVARRRLPGAPLLELDVRSLPFEGEFDVVGAFDVLEHIPEDREALDSLRRAIVPGGGLIITVPQHPRLWSAADDYAHHQRRYTRRELVAKLEVAGFDIVRMTSFVTLLLPFMALSRIRNRSRKSFDLRRELELPAVVDGAFAHVLSIERALIRAGLSLPRGGSLLAVARRPT